MANARMVREITVRVDNRPGVLAGVMETLAGAGVNLQAFTAYVDGQQGFVKLVADDADRAIGALGASGLDCRAEDALAVRVDDTVGAAAKVARAIAEAGLNVTHSHGSAGGTGQALLVVDTDDNAKALQTLGR